MFNTELVTLIPEWKFVQDRDFDESVEWHCYTVLWLVCEDSGFKAMSKED